MSDDGYKILIGDTWWCPHTWAVIVGGAGVDLTDDDWTVRAQIRCRPTDNAVLHDFTGTGITLGSATVQVAGTPVDTSTVRLHIPASVTAGFDVWWGVWDVELSHPTRGLGGTLWRRTFRSGKAHTVKDVTR